MHKKILCIVLILLICFFTTYVLAEEDIENKIETKDLQTQREELKNQLDEANENLDQVQSDLSENLKQIEKLDERIEKTEKDLEKQESKIEELKKEIEKTEDILKNASKKYNIQKKLFEQRMVAIYEAGETRYLDIVLNSKSLSDFISSYYIITELARIDDDLLDELYTKKNTIDLSKQKLEKEKKELALIAENQIRTSKTLQNTKTMRQNFIEKLSDEERQLQELIDQVNKEYEIVNRQILELAEQGLAEEYVGGELAWPVPGYTRITSKYAMRVHPITQQYKLHTGVDISAPMGANFIAVNDGKVIKAEMAPAYGNMVIIDHGGGITTLYAHGSEILVEVGQMVKRGEVVLKIGSTGYSTGPHAHFEVRIKGETTDPLPYITTGLVPGTEEDKKNDNNTNN